MDRRESSNSIKKEDIYNSKKEVLVLASLSDLYSELEAISVRPSSKSTSYYLLTT